MARFAPNGLDLVLALLRDGLPATVTVMTRIPDGVPDVVPLVVVRQVSGTSRVPEFWDRPVINIQNWVPPDPAGDTSRVGSDLADQIRRVLWSAWRTQKTTPAGHIVKLAELSAPMEIGDPDLIHYGRFQASYQLTIRAARAA